jgi:hypothetical protein
VFILHWVKIKEKAWKPRVGKDDIWKKQQELGLIEKLSRIEDDTTPLNIDRATYQDETFRATFKI